MKSVIDRIVLNRLISTILNFIIGILSIFAPKSVEDIKPKKWFSRFRKNVNK